ncbi:ABC transporter substrate-binding protein [Nordella sp. HKS 07]|uniref:ABC transporter substrate-binding protein n=1 Tax=Nordella sp. HKS 07 TaxID=2712222 RepID=UPI0013E198AA|nr:ABC transporter substrate-binding protein [Nordella sp. HKS 07]QIG50934.1 ABC transporter substrate-binding protein [Nordella sp. HKS 07]
MRDVAFFLWLTLLCIPLAATAQSLTDKPVVFPARATSSATLDIHAATDLPAMEPLIRDFQLLAPEITINYFEYVTNDLYRAAAEACRTGRFMGDILLSSSVDQLIKLANDGCATPHSSAETARVSRWANWRDEVFGFTYEPSIFVYDSRMVPPEDVPRSHAALAELLRRRIDFYRGRIGTYDIRLSGIGYLLAYSDARQTTTVYGRLLESMSRADVVTRCCNSEILDQIAGGQLYIGYNILGSYAYAAMLRNPDLRIVVPEDYTLVLRRGALISRAAPNMAAAARFLDYLLSERGQRVSREKAFFFAEDEPSPKGVDGPETLKESGVARPIRIGPYLLAAQDQQQRQRFIADWTDVLFGSAPGSGGAQE